MAKYLVGTGHGMWQLSAAIENASSGDIIELQRGYNVRIDVLSIDKDLTFLGATFQNDTGGITFDNTIIGRLHITNGATVVFQDLWFECNQEKTNILNCKAGAKVRLVNVVLENSITQGKAYPVIYAENEVELTLEKVQTKINENINGEIYAKNCTVTANQCKFINCKIGLSKSELEMTYSKVNSKVSNVINAVDSKVTMDAVEINGCSSDLNYPAIWGNNSSFTVKNSTILKPQYDAAVYLIKNSCFEADLSSVTSIDGYNSRVILKNSTVKEFLGIQDESYAYVDGKVDFLGQNEEKVDIYVGNKSAVLGEKFCFNRVINPNMKAGNCSLLEIREWEYPQGDVADLIIKSDETSKVSVPRPAVPETVPVPASGTAKGNAGTAKDNARRQLEQMTGLKSVKREIEKMLRMVEFNQQRIAKGLEPQEQSFHSVFLGNPGTGKTTVARLIGEVLFESGAFKSDEFKLIEASEPDFISQNVGGTAQQTLALLEKAKGGVLFIDEAYALNKKDANVNFGIEAINTILKYMEDHRGEIMIIFAGYTKEMEQFLKTNPGLTSRVPNKFVFEDYTPDEIVEIGVRDLNEKQYRFENQEYYEQQVKRAYRNSLDHSNARWIRNFNEKLLKSLADRVMNTGDEDFETIRKVDVDDVMAQSKYANLGKAGEDAMTRLKKLIGIQKVKEQVDQFISLAEFNQKREEQGMENGDFTLHSLFLGNPGTGKTTVARIIGEILYQKGIIAQKKFIEVSQSELVAGYVGQTAIKTREVLESALGGVLFIDEAYSLTQGNNNEFGVEAINEILKFMEDHRKDIVIILAGYTKEMGEFMKANSGLTSRIPHTFDFEDYTPDEIVQIGLLNLHSNGYQVEETVYSDVVKNCYRNSDDHSNGRWVRNLNEKLIMIMSKRVSASENADINLVLEEDLNALADSFGVSGGGNAEAGQASRRIDENGYVMPN